MNLLLLEKSDFVSAHSAVFLKEDRRYKHLRSVLKKESGSQFKVGLINGKTGLAEVTQASDDRIEIKFSLEQSPPAPLPVKLVLALPRPKVVLRALQSATTMGVKEIFLTNAFKVEKAFWSCEQLKASSIDKALRLGLEQARDTVLPKVYLERRLKPFVEDRLDSIAKDSIKIVAHPSAVRDPVKVANASYVIVIGPEGGFIDYEVEMFKALKFETISLGERILKSEAAMISLLSIIQNSHPTFR